MGSPNSIGRGKMKLEPKKSLLNVTFRYLLVAFLSTYLSTLLGPVCVLAEGSDGGAGEGKEVKAVEEDKDPATLTPGVIASRGSASGDVGDLKIGDINTGVAENKASPVSASIVDAGSGKCRIDVTNNSKKNTYALSYEVIISTGVGKSTRNFSTNLAAGKVSSNHVSCDKGAAVKVVLKKGLKRKK